MFDKQDKVFNAWNNFPHLHKGSFHFPKMFVNSILEDVISIRICRMVLDIDINIYMFLFYSTHNLTLWEKDREEMETERVLIHVYFT